MFKMLGVKKLELRFQTLCLQRLEMINYNIRFLQLALFGPSV